MTPTSCRHCGQPLRAGAAFCGGCGHAIEADPAATPVHEAVARLVGEHGEGVLAGADQFRAVLDDYLAESTAPAGTIYLLTEAVRLGALDALRSMVAAGAPPESAVEAAGERLARDRGTTEPATALWACAALGYAVGVVPATVVGRYDEPGTVSRGTLAPSELAGVQPQASATDEAPAALPDRPTLAAPAALPPPPPVYAAPPAYVPPAPVQPPTARADRRRTGRVVLVGVLAVLVMFGVGTGTAYLLTRGDDPPSDRASDNSSRSDDGTEDATDPATTPGVTPTATVTVTEETTADDPEAALRDTIAADRAAADGLVGYWVPQLASISAEINGSWSSALAEYEELKGFFPDLLLVDAAEWPHAFVPSETLDQVFVVLSPAPASTTSAPVLDWCQLNRGDRQASCYAKLLETSGSPRNNSDQNEPEPEFN